MGAGPGGLCSAYVLSKAGVPTTVVEKAPVRRRAGAHDPPPDRVRRVQFDIGGHRWFTKNDELNDLFREVVAEELLWVNRISRIYFDGKYVDYPLKICNALKAIGPVIAAKAMADYGRTRVEQRISPTPIVSMEDAYIDQFGPTLYELFFQRYSEKVWGLPCDQMSGDWVAQRSKGMSLVTAVKDAVVPSKGKVVSLIDEFMYPRYGFGRFSERMADAIDAAGQRDPARAPGSRRSTAKATGSTGVTVATENGTERIEADNFISSIPLTVLAKIIEPAAPADVLAAADSLTFRNIITVNLMLKKRQVTPDTWLYVHDRNILFGRFHEPKNWSPAMVPSDEYTSLVVEYFCSFGDQIWNMTEEQLVEQTVKHLVEDLKFITPDEVHRRLHRPRAARLPGLRHRLRGAAGQDQGLHRRARESADHRPLRHVPVQQHRPLDRDRSAGREEHPRRAARSRPGQRRRGVPRDQARRGTGRRGTILTRTA